MNSHRLRIAMSKDMERCSELDQDRRGSRETFSTLVGMNLNETTVLSQRHSDAEALYLVSTLIERFAIGSLALIVTEPHCSASNCSGYEHLKPLIKDYRLDNSQMASGIRQEQMVLTEIHDAFAGMFTAILMQLQAVTDLPPNDTHIRKDCLLRAQELARTGLRQVRELVEANDLSGSQIDDFLAAMQKLVLSVASDATTEGTLQVKGVKRRLKSAVCLALQRILQEAVKNTKQYAHATTLAVQFCFEEDRVVLEVKDDGKGFTPDTSLELGFGLVSMRARVDRLGGGLWLCSFPGQGTSIRVDIPNPYANEEKPK